MYEALLTWVKYDPEARREDLDVLLKLIRLPLVSPLYFFDTISKEELIRTNLASRDLLEEAIYYHLLPEKRSHLNTFALKPRCCNDAFGLIYTMGGLNANGGSVSTVEVYDCGKDNWRRAETMGINRSRVSDQRNEVDLMYD